MNLSNLMQVFKTVTDLDKVSVAVGMSPESIGDDVEEKVGNISDFFLNKSQTWNHLENLLQQSNEMQAVDIVVLMKNYICEGITSMLYHVFFHVTNWKQSHL